MKKLIPVLGLGLMLVACTQGEQPAANNAEVTNNAPAVETTNNAATNNATVNTSLTENNASTTEVAISGEMTNGKLAEIFLGEYPNAQITGISYDFDDGRDEFQIDGIQDGKEVDLEIDAKTGEIIKKDTEDDDRTNDTPLDLAQVKPWAEAVEKAKAEVNGGRLESFDLDVENGKAEYEVEFEGNDQEVILDANTLEILRVDR
ncbi:PepSY domain-containing protein [Peptoniphilus sp. KCTC 25270]|uniref:PepSY domain-containing protein n=1 Tax=Peptoniphilus sp. KCTC 25270 TaxID=2897414 RepID=UPI001E591008|nr:PepSY domain-containing protein [Peptoniphilus sp. KCTC 25270]MCD1147674.1 PepSY domain-containing protein [Peptoniphilus sp. KCTC 25270]